MVSKNIIKKYKLDEEEIELLKEEEKEITEKENEIFFNTAIDELKNKDKLISLRVNSKVINNIKIIANNFGLSYQSYIGVLLNQASKGNIKLIVEQK